MLHFSFSVFYKEQNKKESVLNVCPRSFLQSLVLERLGMNVQEERRRGTQPAATMCPWAPVAVPGSSVK